MKKLIVGRQKDEIFKTFSREQASFTPGSSRIDEVNSLMRRTAENKPNLHLAFVDVENTFDSINRKNIWESRQAYRSDKGYI